MLKTTVVTETGFTGNSFILELGNGNSHTLGVHIPAFGEVTLYAGYAAHPAASPVWQLVGSYEASGVYSLNFPLQWIKLVIENNSSTTQGIAVWAIGEGA